MQLIQTPEGALYLKITFDLYSKTISISEADNFSHPHWAHCCIWEGCIHQYPHTNAMTGISFKSHRFGLIFFLTVVAEFDLGVEEVEAILVAADRVVF